MDPAMLPRAQPVRAVRAAAAGIANSTIDRSGVDNLLRAGVFVGVETDSALKSRAASFW